MENGGMMKRASLDRKGSREREGRPSRSKKRPMPPNRHEFECEVASTSASAKKLKTSSMEVPINAGHGYRILNFLTLFSSLADMIKCKECNGNITFMESSIRGLGFRLVVTCNKCEPRYINSCPIIGQAYDINRRFIFAMRLFGIGYDGARKFCGFMDLTKIFTRKVYNEIMTNIHCATKAVATKIFSEAVVEEKRLTANVEGIEPAGLTISGDGTWMKRGFSSLHGTVTLIGYYSGQVIDVIIKSLHCKQCEYWSQNMDTEEYETWKESHENECSRNHEGSAGKMEVDGAIEMFARSEDLHGVKYLSYIGDGDSKTFKGITESQPYGENFIITKKECVCHVQKRMGARLRNLKKKIKELSGKGKLTGKLIDELSIYYGLAIRRNKNSVQDMKKAIWATLQHKSSTDNNPQHENCPPGLDSWCTWQKAKTENKLNEYTHKEALPDVVIKAITPVYEELSKDELLHRCLGGFTQNNNESLNSLIWSFAPKRVFTGAKTVEIATYIAASIFSKGYASILSMMHIMNLTIGPNAVTICEQLNEERVSQSEARTFAASKEGRIERRRHQTAMQDEEEGSFYEAGMAD